MTLAGGAACGWCETCPPMKVTPITAARGSEARAAFFQTGCRSERAESFTRNLLRAQGILTSDIVAGVLALDSHSEPEADNGSPLANP